MRIIDYIKKLDGLVAERNTLLSAMQAMDYKTNSRAYKALAAEQEVVLAEIEAIRNMEVDEEERPYDPEEDDE